MVNQQRTEVISAFIIIKTKARQHAIAHSEQSYNRISHHQFQQYCHLIIASFLLVILAVRHVILTLVSGLRFIILLNWIFYIIYSIYAHFDSIYFSIKII
jgi:hypothetical protein